VRKKKNITPRLEGGKRQKNPGYGDVKGAGNFFRTRIHRPIRNTTKRERASSGKHATSMTGEGEFLTSGKTKGFCQLPNHLRKTTSTQDATFGRSKKGTKKRKHNNEWYTDPTSSKLPC